MPAVLVHGVPETPRIWDGVRKHLSRSDVLTPNLPGFDAPRPDGFASTKEAYVDWLIAELENIGEPVDLVGHDFGCIFVTRVGSLRPDLVRTLTSISGPIDADYVWHEFAQIWQAPGEGEKWMADFKPAEFASALVQDGVSQQEADGVVSFVDDTMKDSILRLYRSSVTLGAEWQPGLKNVASPHLILWGLLDHYLPHRFADRMGEATKAELVVKLRAGHWLVTERPSTVASQLEAHWSRQF